MQNHPVLSASASPTLSPAVPVQPAIPAPGKRLRAWPGLVLVALFWIAFAACGYLELAMFPEFLVRFGALLVVTLAFLGWWLFVGAIGRAERFLVFGWTVGGAVVAILLADSSVIAPSVFFLAVPALLTCWALWLAASPWLSPRVRQVGLFVLPVLFWTPMTLVWMDGLGGSGQGLFYWRWSLTPEQKFLQQEASQGTPVVMIEAATPLVAAPADWTEFRGPNRDGAVHGIKIATNWDETPPKLLWKRLVGPGWSSTIVVGKRLFTQEQRDQVEAITCYDTDTGNPVWVHTDTARFVEKLGGIGPRATPTFAEGRIYALGATGILNCLDAATGKKHWSRNIATDAGADVPMWGFAGSPLVVDSRVIVFAGGKGEKSLLAYDCDSGEPTWTASAGEHSYSSPQLLSMGGQQQVLFLSDKSFSAFEPASGKVLWQYAAGSFIGQPSLQPQLVGAADLIFSFTPNAGTTRLHLSGNGLDWHHEVQWTSTKFNPFFNDFVLAGDALYGFDGNIFCCVDVQTGSRRWKNGRYGNGQVLLLADQPLLLVLGEFGEVILVAANANQHEELGRFQALVESKTWNHPVICGDRLYVRNAQEMACYELRLVQ